LNADHQTCHRRDDAHHQQQLDEREAHTLLPSSVRATRLSVNNRFAGGWQFFQGHARLH